MSQDTYSTLQDNVVAYLAPIMGCTDMGPEEGCCENSLFLALYELGDRYYGPALYRGLWRDVRDKAEAWDQVKAYTHSLAASYFMRCQPTQDGLVDLEIEDGQVFPLRRGQLRLVFFHWMKWMCEQVEMKGWDYLTQANLSYWLEHVVLQLYPDIEPIPHHEGQGLSHEDRF